MAEIIRELLLGIELNRSSEATISFGPSAAGVIFDGMLGVTRRDVQDFDFARLDAQGPTATIEPAYHHQLDLTGPTLGHTR
ncbi:hypothetical protein LRM36_02565 [Stenotrophomonas maltophilia]|nr:hypothetical protein [Stenotrophomonas maltophilia]